MSDALKDGDRIYATIRGGALSNDGRTPGIANPSYEAQVDLVKSACRNARVYPSEIVYVEAHGTGTRVGDKTEANALGEVMGRHRGPQHPPLYIGSVKSNLGHTEGAAGVPKGFDIPRQGGQQGGRTIHPSIPSPDKTVRLSLDARTH